MADIRHRVGIAASREQVYEALATREGLSGWWTRDTAGDPAVGGEAGVLLRPARAGRGHGGRRTGSWPAVPDEAYYALAGATAELVRAEVRHGRIDAVRDLEDMLVNLHLAVLAARPWGRPAGPA